jgi:pilus assembly protein CpaF
VDLIVHQSRFRDGSRRITSVTEVSGIESGRVQTQELFRFVQRPDASGGICGSHVACGAIPTFREALVSRGVDVDLSLFREEQ